MIGYRQSLATLGFSAAATSKVLTNAGQATLVGDTLCVAYVGAAATNDVPACTDSAGNSYTLVAHVYNSAFGLQVALFAAANSAHSLPAGGTITVTFNDTAQFGGLVAFEVGGAPTQDGTASATGSGTAPDSGASPAVTQSEELVLGIIGWADGAGVITETFTPGTGYTAGPSAQGASASQSCGVFTAYRILTTATGSYHATGTLGHSDSWGAIVATFKGDNARGISTGSIVVLQGTANVGVR